MGHRRLRIIPDRDGNLRVVGLTAALRAALPVQLRPILRPPVGDGVDGRTGSRPLHWATISVVHGEYVPVRFAEAALGGFERAGVGCDHAPPAADAHYHPAVLAARAAAVEPAAALYDCTAPRQLLVRHDADAAGADRLLSELAGRLSASAGGVAVLVRDKAGATRLAAGLTGTGRRVGLLTEDHVVDPRAPVVVATLFGSAVGEALVGRHAVVLADALMAFDRQAHPVLGHPCHRHHLLVGVLADGRPRTRLDEFRLFSAYGSHQVWWPGGRQYPRPVLVGTVPGCPTPQAAARVLRRIAAAARSGDAEAVRTLLPALAPLVAAGGPMRAVVLGGDCRAATPAVPVCTPADFSRLDPGGVDLVVRLDRGPAALPVPERLLARPTPDDRPLVVLDAERAAEGRSGGYRNAGYGPLGESAAARWRRYADRVAVGHGPLVAVLNAAMPAGRAAPVRVHAVNADEESKAPAAPEPDDPVPVLDYASEVRRPYELQTAADVGPFSARFAVAYRGLHRRPPTRAVQGTAAGLPWLEEVMSRENLVCVFAELRAYAGDAAGPDGVRLSDLSLRDAGTLLEPVGHAVLTRDYRPGPTRPVAVSKASGGTRTIRIGNVVDRVAAGAVYRAVVPAVDPRFRPESFGFRPGRSHLHLLARLARAVQAGLHVVTADDVATAFDRVGLDRLEETVARHVADDHYRWLIRTIARGGQDLTRKDGVHQGNAISPLLLNLYLHDGHDRPLYGGRPTPPFAARYADNIVVATRTVREGNDWHERTTERIHAIGMTLKGVPGRPIDLRRQPLRLLADLAEPEDTAHTVPLLGFDLSLGNAGLQFRPLDCQLTGLRDALVAAHDTPDPTASAGNVVSGYLTALGPALATHHDQIIRSTRHQLRDTGHSVPPRDVLGRAATMAARQWDDMVRATAPVAAQ